MSTPAAISHACSPGLGYRKWSCFEWNIGGTEHGSNKRSSPDVSDRSFCGAGVIAVAVFGLYGAATSKWDMSVKVEESGAFDAFWDTIAFIVNAIVFFYSGVACINFFVRCGPHMDCTIFSQQKPLYTCPMLLSLPCSRVSFPLLWAFFS